MRTKLLFCLVIISSAMFADPTIFSLTLGETTEKELLQKFRATLDGVNKWTGGKMYKIQKEEIDFEGLQEVTAIFNESGKLVGVLTSFPKSKFKYLQNLLDQKYKCVVSKIPFVGNKSITYEDGSTEILLEAAHLSFEAKLSYIHKELFELYSKQSHEEKMKKEASEKSQI